MIRLHARAPLLALVLLLLQGCGMTEPTGDSSADPEAAEWIGTILSLGGVLTAIAIFVLAWDFVRGARKGNRQFRWAERFRRRRRGEGEGQSAQPAPRGKQRNSP